MAKNINHIQHVKSSVVIDGAPKLPTPDVLVEGELAINYASGVETISVKNSSGNIVTFSSDSYFNEKYIGDFSGKTVEDVISENESAITAAIIDLDDRVIAVEESLEGIEEEILEKVDDKLGSGFTGQYSGRTVTDVIYENELVISHSLNDLNDRKLDASAYTPTDLSNYYTKGEVDEKTSGITSLSDKIDVISGDVETISEKLETISGDVIENELVIASSLTDLDSRIREVSAKTGDGVDELADMIESISGVVEENEIVTAAALNDLNARKLDASAYTETDLSNYYTKSEIDNAELATTAALLDLNERKLDSSAYTPTDLSNYYTINDIDAKLGSGFTGQHSGRTITQAIVEDEFVLAGALNDLNERKLDASAFTPTDLSNYYTKSEVDGFVDSLSGIIEDNELVIASSLTDLDTRKLDVSAHTEALSNYYTKNDIDDAELAISAALNDLNGKINELSGNTPLSVFDESVSGSNRPVEAQALYSVIVDNEYVISSALNNLNSRLDAIENMLNALDSRLTALGG